jgi:hypothetical protein
METNNLIHVFSLPFLTDLSKPVPISLNLQKFDPQTQRIVFTADLVDSGCSGFRTDLKDKFIVKGDELIEGQSLNCIRLIKSDSPVIVNYTLLASLLGPTDLLTIRSGGSEFSSPLVARIDSENLHSVRKDVRKQLSPGKNLRISYTSHFVSNRAAAPEIAFSATPASKIVSLTNDTAAIQITDEPGAIFLIEVQSGDRAKIDFKAAKPASLVLSFFSSADVSETKPFLVLPVNQISPDVVVSPTNILRIVASGSGRVDGTAGVESAINITDATAIGDEDSVSFLTSSIKPGTSATWLIPGRTPATGSISLVIKQVTLDVTGSSVSITRLGSKTEEIVKEEWQSGLQVRGENCVLNLFLASILC